MPTDQQITHEAMTLDSTGKLLLMRSGINLSNQFFIVSIFKVSEEILIEAENSTLEAPLTTTIPYSSEEFQ